MIQLFGTEGCQPCRATKRRLDSKGINYTYTDVNLDEDALATIQALGYKQVPVLIKGDTHFGGFQPDRIDALA